MIEPTIAPANAPALRFVDAAAFWLLADTVLEAGVSVDPAAVAADAPVDVDTVVPDTPVVDATREYTSSASGAAA